MRIALLTTGGDAPGMNAAIRAVVRRSLSFDWEVWGVTHGFQGLFEDEFQRLTHGSVSGIINHGGTILGTRRCPGFKEEVFRQTCYQRLENHQIEGMVVIGGDGSLSASKQIAAETNLPIAFIPASIDNDIAGTEETIGFDTAVNTALEAIDKIRDTATSHQRVFLVEIMGKEKGFLALSVGLTAGAEAILVPEIPFTTEGVVQTILQGRQKGKQSMIIVVAEGAASVSQLTKEISALCPGEIRYSVLGYIQRGGNPSGRSRFLSFLFGARAVEALAEGKKTVFVGLEANQVVVRNLQDVGPKKILDESLYRLAHILAA